MKATFIETTEFTGWVSEFLSDVEYATTQNLLMNAPDSGDVMPGCGGLRKLRVVDSQHGKGKRGGARIIYLHLAISNQFYMIDIYGKTGKDDLTAPEKRVLTQLAKELKDAALASHNRLNGEPIR